MVTNDTEVVENPITAIDQPKQFIHIPALQLSQAQMRGKGGN